MIPYTAIDTVWHARGGAFTDRLAEFRIIDERGNEPPDSFRRAHAGTEENALCL